MDNTLEEIAKQLGKADAKVQLIYAFNCTGKTRLSREFKKQITDPMGFNSSKAEETEGPRDKILYYNALTEDLFYWDNDLEGDAGPKLIIQPNKFTDWLLIEQGQADRVIETFQRYTSDKLTPHFNYEQAAADKEGKNFRTQAFSDVTFTVESGDETQSGNLKISKGEESNFIWSIFYSSLQLAIEDSNPDEFIDQSTSKFNGLKYIFIDDPVSSLDDNCLIRIAVDLAYLIKLNKSEVKFIITTHSPLFFNVLSNELCRNEKNTGWKGSWVKRFHLQKNEDGKFSLMPQKNDSPFAYHLCLISQLQAAIKSGQLQKYHFNLLRNVLEKTATFLGYEQWEDLLPITTDGSPDLFAKRIVNFGSHSRHVAEEPPELKPQDKEILRGLLEHLVDTYKFCTPDPASPNAHCEHKGFDASAQTSSLIQHAGSCSPISKDG